RVEALASDGTWVSASGLVIDTDGNVVTLARLAPAAGAAPPSRASITLSDGARRPAQLVGTDWLTGVSVVRLTRAPRDLTAARFGDSDLVEVGDWAVGVGRGAG